MGALQTLAILSFAIPWPHPFWRAVCPPPRSSRVHPCLLGKPHLGRQCRRSGSFPMPHFEQPPELAQICRCEIDRVDHMRQPGSGLDVPTVGGKERLLASRHPATGQVVYDSAPCRRFARIQLDRWFRPSIVDPDWND